MEVRHTFGLPLSAGHPQLQEPRATTAHTLLLGCAAKMPCLYLNSSSALGSQSSPSPSDHAHQDPGPKESQPCWWISWGLWGWRHYPAAHRQDALRATFTWTGLHEHSAHGSAKTTREAQVTLFFWWLSTYATQLVSPQKKALLVFSSLLQGLSVLG